VVPLPTSDASPLRASERVQELDVLRGVVLFGVFFMNMLDFSMEMSTEPQVTGVSSWPLDGVLYVLTNWLVDDKAITLFAFLFGLGFQLQMQRLVDRGADFERVYLRRMTFLLVLGLLHRTFLWTWDILHVYALAGFALFALRNARARTLLVGGIALALLADPIHEVLLRHTWLRGWHGMLNPYSDAATLARQQPMIAGDYLALVAYFARHDWIDSVLRGTLVSLFCFSLGRFMLGAWVGQRGWFQDCARYLPGFRRVLRVALPIGLVGAFVGQALEHLTSWNYTAFALHVLAQLPLAAGYAAGVVVAFHTPLGRRLLTPFAHPGRMALSNYVGQSVLCGLVFTGVGPGLALIGRIGVGEVMLISIALYAVQVLASRWWLARYRVGPLEGQWRGYTYQELPALRRAPLPVTT